MAQSVEQFTRNEQVISSNLITSSKKISESFPRFFYPSRSWTKLGMSSHRKVCMSSGKSVYIVL